MLRAFHILIKAICQVDTNLVQAVYTTAQGLLFPGRNIPGAGTKC